MKINIAISEKDRQAISNLLTNLLADEYVLYTKTRNYHWNVTGMHFNDLHKFFEAQYTALNVVVDDVAERIRTLGFRTKATLSEFIKISRLREHPGIFPNAKEMIANLLKDYETIIQVLRKNVDETASQYHDAGTSDFLTGLMEEHEKTAWMLRSFLEGK